MRFSPNAREDIAEKMSSNSQNVELGEVLAVVRRRRIILLSALPTLLLGVFLLTLLPGRAGQFGSDLVEGIKDTFGPYYLGGPNIRQEIMATSISVVSYSIDHGVYPPSRVHTLPTGETVWTTIMDGSPGSLTTPVAYLSHAQMDYFTSPREWRLYHNRRWLRQHRTGVGTRPVWYYSWGDRFVVWSVGPNEASELDPEILVTLSKVEVLPYLRQNLYDPTNGPGSSGDVAVYNTERLN